jgi:demethylmenaquinone methyltransferase/2-methoxy-6-polyprenyl-1,4-benzoquinol methylase
MAERHATRNPRQEKGVTQLDPKLLERDPERIAGMFSQVAPRYDLLNHLLSGGLDRSWRRTAVRAARPEGARRILDLATGTGDLAFELARAPGFEGEVLGIDLSSEMVRRAREKASANGLDRRVQFREGDALRVPEADGAFDVVSVGFGVRNFADPQHGLREALRLLAPGGRFVVLEFFRRRETPLLRAYLDHALPRIGRWISGSPSAYAYLRSSTKGFLSPEEFEELLRSVGFGPVVSLRLTFGIAHCIVATRPGGAV